LLIGSSESGQSGHFKPTSFFDPQIVNYAAFEPQPLDATGG
jgi:hypothetical protein